MSLILRSKDCELCGSPFHQTSINQKYCRKACRSAANKRYQKDYDKNHRKTPRAIQQPNTMEELRQLANEAVAQGTSYGKYVAGLRK